MIKPSRQPFWFWHLSNVFGGRSGREGDESQRHTSGSPGRRVLIRAIDYALAAEWEAALDILRAYTLDPSACQIHAIIFRLRGDKQTAMDWYRRAGFTTWPNTDPQGQLLHLRQELDWQY